MYGPTWIIPAASMALAQLDDRAPTPTPLPAGPVWERLLMENPWPLIVICGAAGLIAFFIFLRRGRPGRGAIAAAGAAILMAGMWTLAHQVVTEREQVKGAAAELVDAAAKADIPRLDRLLDDSATAYTIVTPGGMSKSGILAEVRRKFGDEYSIKEYDIQESQATIDGPGVGRAQLRVHVREGTTELPFTSWWGLDLRRDEGGRWRTTAIRPLHPWIAGPQAR